MSWDHRVTTQQNRNQELNIRRPHLLEGEVAGLDASTVLEGSEVHIRSFDPYSATTGSCCWCGSVISWEIGNAGNSRSPYNLGFSIASQSLSVAVDDGVVNDVWRVISKDVGGTVHLRGG